MRIATIWAAILVAIMGCQGAFGAGFTDPKNQFSFDPPGNWQRIPQAEVDKWDPVEGAEKIGGYRDSANPDIFCTIMKMPAISNPAGSVGEFRQGLAAPDAKVLDAHWDAKRAALVGEVRVTTSMGAVDYRVYAFTRSDATIVFYCYAPDAAFGTARGTFETMADSFHFDGAAAEGGSPSTTILAVLGSLVCAGMSFVMVVLMGAAIFVMVKKSKKAPAMAVI